MQNGKTCPDLAKFPGEIIGAVGANLNGTPIVCGGTSYDSNFIALYLRKCFKLTSAGWQEFASMKETRGYAEGVVYNNKFHVFGGTSDMYVKGLQTSEIISIDGGVEYGPELPLPWSTTVFEYAITAINTTVSILSGGIDVSNYGPSAKTWYYNHETKLFSSGPSLLEARYAHDSATCVDKVTNDRIPVVTGGKSKQAGGEDSTEQLINGEWQPGTYILFNLKNTIFGCELTLQMPFFCTIEFQLFQHLLYVKSNIGYVLTTSLFLLNFFQLTNRYLLSIFLVFSHILNDLCLFVCFSAISPK